MKLRTVWLVLLYLIETSVLQSFSLSVICHSIQKQIDVSALGHTVKATVLFAARLVAAGSCRNSIRVLCVRSCFAAL